jgi:(p)ppGpp synthase/HD superfamily hydrolase
MVDWEARFEEAQRMALNAHQGQRYGAFSYDYHLGEVVKTLLESGVTLHDPKTAPILVAAWLHDSLEDTNLDYELIRDRFGDEVAELVWRVTDEPGQNRKERKAATYLKTRQDEKAIALKLADRIANVRASKQNNPKLFRMYAKEQPEFSQALRPWSNSQLALRLWENLDQYFA